MVRSAKRGEAEPRVVVIGAASVDIKGKALGPLVPATSNPGEIKWSIGGVGRNVAENLGRLGVPTILLTAVGDDAFGQQIVERTAAGGVDMRHVLISDEQRTGTYVAVLSPAGEMTVSIDDMRITELLTPDYVRAHIGLLRAARLIVLDGNLAVRTLGAVLTIAKRAGVPVCADPVSLRLAPRLKPRLCDYTILTPNAQEAEILTEMPVRSTAEAARAAHHLITCGVKIAIITLAEEGLFYASSQGSGHIPASRCEVVDATGAGDALTAGVVFGLVNDLPLDECMRLGVSAATITLRSPETVCPEMSQELLFQRMVI